MTMKDCVERADLALAEATRAGGRERQLWLLAALAWAQAALDPKDTPLIKQANQREDAARTAAAGRAVS